MCFCVIIFFQRLLSLFTVNHMIMYNRWFTSKADIKADIAGFFISKDRKAEFASLYAEFK